MKPTRQVAVLIETSREYGRGLLRGVIAFNRKNPSWSIYFQQQDLGQPIPDWLKTWEGDGILARVTNITMARQLIKTGLPLIDLRGATRELGLPTFGIDNQSVATTAFSHLASRGLRNFAFVGEPSGRHVYDDLRQQAFVDLVAASGSKCHVYSGRSRRSTADWGKRQDALANWLSKLPQPIGVMCCHDDRGHQVLDACRRAELQVPDQVAVIAVDNDEFLCQLAIPPLTSVDVDAERIGYEAARLLDAVMRGDATFNKSLMFDSIGVVERQSTDIVACDDKEVAKALRFIRDNACNQLTVLDVEQHVAISRTVLNRRFKQVVGRTPKQEIVRLQLERGKRLLSTSNGTVESIAHQSGFNEAWYFIKVFRDHVGVTPGAYRRGKTNWAF